MMKKLLLAMLTCTMLLSTSIAFAADDEDTVAVSETTQSEQLPMVQNVSITTLDGQQTTLKALYSEKPVYVNLWATWCPPCVGELPHINQLYQKYGDKINFVMINLDENVNDTTAFLNKSSLSMPIYRGNMNALNSAFQLEFIPVSVIIDTNGRILNRVSGGMTEEQLEQFIAPLLQ
jgi:thiol-disulfide isomerase/thioredoxin